MTPAHGERGRSPRRLVMWTAAGTVVVVVAVTLAFVDGPTHRHSEGRASGRSRPAETTTLPAAASTVPPTAVVSTVPSTAVPSTVTRPLPSTTPSTTRPTATSSTVPGRATATNTVPTATPRFGPSSGRPFLEAGAWNSRIPVTPVLDPDSGPIAGYLGSENLATANLYEFGIPIYYAERDTPRHDVRCTKPWGTCELELAPVPVPDDAAPNDGSDGAMIVIDWSTRTSYEFWQARKDGGAWVVSWGDVIAVDGSGSPSTAVGAGVSRLAGVVRTYELKQGSIPHALVFSTDNACQERFRDPATKTDGHSRAPDCIPQGTRIQLDPAVDVDRIPGMTAGERVVAKALQMYGAYAVDNGGAKMAFSFEMPTRDADPYPAAGFDHDYYAMRHIPWDRLRVLRQWDGR